jgi:hypothetical protein
MQKLLIHNLSIPYTHQPSDLYLFDHNALFFAEPGDAIVLRRELPDQAFLAYLMRESTIVPPLHFFVSTNHPSPFSIFEDNKLLEQLKLFFLKKDIHEWKADTFMTSPYEKQFADSLGISFPYNPSHYATFGTKSAFRKTAKQLGIAIPRGSENRTDALSLVLACMWLLIRGAQAMVLKQDEGVAGLGSRRFTRQEFMRIMRAFRFEELFPSLGITPVSTTRYIVEEWHEDVVMSPSAQCHIAEGGSVEVLSIHNQLMKENGMTYRGCQSEHWLSESVRSDLLSGAQTYSQALSQYRYRGHLAFNAILLKSGKLLFTEVNPRRVMSSYPFQIMRRLGFARGAMPPYMSLELKRDEWKGTTHDELLRRCGKLLYTKERGSGLIPFDVKLLRAHGAAFFLAIGPSKEEAEQYIEHARVI